MTRRTGAALFIAIYSVAYVIAGLYPYDFDFGQTLRVYSIGNWEDVAANIAAFVPFGFAFAAAPLTRRPCLTAAIFCTVLALCVELLQNFVPERFPQVSDVICNGAGGWFGAWLWLRIAPVESKLSGTSY
jgi:glycopeptide antibiotics resistance protein